MTEAPPAIFRSNGDLDFPQMAGPERLATAEAAIADKLSGSFGYDNFDTSAFQAVRPAIYDAWLGNINRKKNQIFFGQRLGKYQHIFAIFRRHKTQGNLPVFNPCCPWIGAFRG